jgi:histidinol-phosphate aminotransferase
MLSKKTKKYIKRIKDLDYPEYSHKTKTSQEIARGYGTHNGLDLELLDLSLGQNDTIRHNLSQILAKSLENVGKYSFAQNEELINLISKKNNIPVENILITQGCDGALRILSSFLINEDSQICIPIPSFGRYEYHTKVNCGNISFINFNKFPFSFDIKKITKFYKSSPFNLIFLANPNNPTGAFLEENEITQLLKQTNSFIILDEALSVNKSQSCIELIKEHPKLIVTRSFSKIYGLAGLRLGYIVADKEIIDLAKKLTSPFEVASIAILAAIETLSDSQFFINSQKQLKASLKELKKINSLFKDINITPTQSSTAVIQLSAKRSLYYELLRKGIKTISCNDFRGLEDQNCVRISIKDPDSMEKLIKKLKILQKEIS